MSAPDASADSALSAEAARVAPELYFLMAKFLSHGPLQATAEALRKELEEKKVLPTRLDWEGRTHDQSFEELESQFSHVTSNHLLEVCVQLLRRSALTPRVSLLSRGVAGRHARPPSAAARHDIVSRLLRRAEGRSPWHAGGAGGCGAALLSPRLFSSLELQRRTLGHLSAVYCVMYDRTGNYIITGADDLLVKVWSAIDGRLLMTCRGASSEITDVCVSSDNRLLCAGSLDRHIRVWELQSGAPVAVLQGHSGMITSVHFCPARSGDLRCLVSTSTDGSVAFWTYSQSGQHGKPSFISKPVQYMERMRPGACHMICCCWSPGGVFLAAGSADHHVRVYMMAHEGPKRILEVAAHSDAVDSLAWCHRGLRFVSGSKDGTAILWQLHAMQWRHTTLHMTTCLPGESLEQEEGKRTKVTMVCWDCSDKYIITAASDHTIKVWCARACRLVRVLRGHTDETYVLEAHPFLSSVLLSASHDGQVIVWDMETGERLLKFLNHMEGQGHGAVYDAKWSPDGSRFAATDSHGHLLMWGFGQSHPNLRQLPPELFFHTDYRPLVRDALGGVLDEQTEVPPHLMPPPFLVDVEGAPHPPRLQRLVPGRENLALSQLIPLTGEAAAEAGGPRSHIDRMIALVLRDLGAREGFLEDGGARNGLAGGGNGAGTVWRGEGVRHTAGLWQRGEPLHNYNCRPLVAPLQDANYDLQAAASEEMSQLEMAWYRREMRRRPQMISTAEAGAASGPRRRAGRTARGARRPRPPPAPRAVPRARVATPPSAPARSDYYDEDSSERASLDATSDTSDTSVRLSVAERFHSTASSDDKSPPSSSSSSSDYSDWVADKPNIALAPPKRSKRRPVVRKRYSPATTPSKRSAAPGTPTPAPAPADTAAPAETNGDAPLDDEANGGGTGGEEQAAMEVELPEPYRPSEWLCAVAPRKAPYHPQMGDECYYLKQGHQSYLEAVSVKDVYKINSRDKPWERTHINECELVKVVGVKYLIRPPRLVCLKLAALQEPHRTFTIKYHDMPDVIDFLVLRQQYEACVARAWAAGDRFRCMIDDMWWTGAVVECLGAPPGSGAGAGGGGGEPSAGAAAAAAGAGRDAARHFLSLRVRWDNGEYERMSPWDLEPIDHERLPTEIGGCMPVLGSELEAVLYRPRPEEWPPDGDRARAARHIVRALDQVMGLSIAEPFVAPVDLNMYPSYAYIVEYPIDLSTIKARFENHFYRRVAAAQFDVRYLATNAEKFNRPHSHIVRQARIVTDLLLHIISDWRDVDVVSTYHSLVEAYRSSDSDTAAPAPSTSRGRGRGRGGRGSWTAECLLLMQELMSSPDAVPFLQPVSDQLAPDYRQVVPCPMDLGTVRSRLQMGQYARAEHFARDVRLVFTNSHLYNTNQRSRIYTMTLRMSNLFEELYRWAARAWRSRRRKDPVEEYATSDEETLAATSRRKRTRRGAGAGRGGAGAAPPATNGHARRSDSWDSDAPLTSQGKGKGVGKKSKPSSAGATQDEASTSRDAPLSSAPSLRLRTPDADEAEGRDASPKVSSEYEELEVLEEELHEDEVEVTYSGAESAYTAPSESSGGDTYHPPARRAHSHRSRHRVRLKRSRKRRRSGSDGGGSRARRPARRRRSKKPSKRRKKRSAGERAVSASSSSTSSPEEAGGGGRGAGAAGAAPARYESDHSYRPRLSSDDSAPLHIYRQTPVELGEGASGSGAGSGAGTSRHRPEPLAHARRSRHSAPHQQTARSRRTLPETRYNEDSEEDSIAAISKRLREHTSHRQSLRARGAIGGRSGGGGGGGGAGAGSSHTADHNYYNGHHAHALRHHHQQPPAEPRAPHHHQQHRPSTSAHHAAPAAAQSHYNGNTSDGGEEEPLSISSRGRVRKLTAKARGLLRD